MADLAGSAGFPPCETRRSPDGAHVLIHIYAGEIRFGPTLYHTKLDGRWLRRHLRKRYFREACVWSPDSRYVALAAFRSVVETRGPDTELVVIDVLRRRWCAPDRARGGFAEPLRFLGTVISYTLTFYDESRTADVRPGTADLSLPIGWRILGPW